MKTLWRADGTQTWFVLAELPVELQKAARGLGFEPFEEGFARAYPADAPHLDRIYRQFADHVEEMLRQKAGGVSVPWERMLLAFLEIVDWHGHRIRVPPLDLQLRVCERRGLTARAELIRAAIGGNIHPRGGINGRQPLDETCHHEANAEDKDRTP